jgi:pimeloyl-ACP methyl ester carboxylesterase
MGSFFIGGQSISTIGAAAETHVLTPNGVPVLIDPNGTTSLGQMYVQYFNPAPESAGPPVTFWHGGSLTGATWESTPDEREGWLSYFFRQGWQVFNVDAVERGRSGWSPRDPHFAAAPFLRTGEDSFTQFRIGLPVPEIHLETLQNAAYPACRFPLPAFGRFLQQVVPRWSTTDDLTLAAYEALLDRIGPAVIVAHSQGGAFAFKAAERHPSKVAAIIAIEPAQGGTDAGAARLADIPVLVVYGDHLDRDRRWPTIRQRTDVYLRALQRSGCRLRVLDLPAAGIAGNSHLMMMESNNLAIAALIEDWLLTSALVQRR